MGFGDNRMAGKIILILACFAAASCATTEDSYLSYLHKKGVTETSIDGFQHCHGYGCKEISKLTLSDSDWREIDALFMPLSQNAEEERARLAPSIGIFETKVGALAGTASDRYGTFHKLGQYQHDCVDESTNTTIYLALLRSKRYLNFHKIEPPSVRLPLIHAGRWPHQTAVISETGNGKLYAVDSWFHDNGYDAEILPLQEWKNGWKPARAQRHGDSSDKE